MWPPVVDGQAGPGEAAVDQVKQVQDFLRLALDDADQSWHAAGFLALRWQASQPATGQRRDFRPYAKA